ncbi:MAG: type II secretion system protein [Rhodothalassiaceae bacterium]|nr:MAG: type II secretion system protein [Rhodothalassiaceae bacterium]
MPQPLIAGLTAADIASILAALAAAVAFWAVWSSGIVDLPARRRLKALEARRQQLRAGVLAPARRRPVQRRERQMALMRRIVERLKLLQSKETEKAEQRLVQAGLRSRDALVVYLFFKLVLPFALAAVSLLLLYGFGMMEASPLLRAMIPVALTLLAFKAPDIVVTNAIQRRSEAIRKSLPDALDLLVICAEAGLTLDAALNRVHRELARAAPELAEEFSLTAIELGFLPDRRQALMNLAERVPLESLRAVVTALIQSEKYGTPLAHALRVLAGEFRKERLMKAEEKAARLPAVMTVPLILFILPALFIVLVGPAACQISDQLINRPGLSDR